MNLSWYALDGLKKLTMLLDTRKSNVLIEDLSMHTRHILRCLDVQSYIHLQYNMLPGIVKREGLTLLDTKHLLLVLCELQ